MYSGPAGQNFGILSSNPSIREAVISAIPERDQFCHGYVAKKTAIFAQYVTRTINHEERFHMVKDSGLSIPKDLSALADEDWSGTSSEGIATNLSIVNGFIRNHTDAPCSII